MLNWAILGLLLILLALAAGLAIRTFNPLEAPAQAHGAPPEGAITRDQLEAALTPIRQRLAALDAAVESQEGKIARASQLANRAGKGDTKAELLAAVREELVARATSGNGALAGDEADGPSAARAPRSRMMRRLG